MMKCCEIGEMAFLHPEHECVFCTYTHACVFPSPLIYFSRLPLATVDEKVDLSLSLIVLSDLKEKMDGDGNNDTHLHAGV
jgi:hypothetical protein